MGGLIFRTPVLYRVIPEIIANKIENIRFSHILLAKDIRFYKDWPLSFLRTLKIGNNFSIENGDIYLLKSVVRMRITIEIFIQIIVIFYFQKFQKWTIFKNLASLLLANKNAPL